MFKNGCVFLSGFRSELLAVSMLVHITLLSQIKSVIKVVKKYRRKICLELNKRLKARVNSFHTNCEM